MTKISDLKGFSYPLTPKGISSVVGNPPWYYGTEHLNIAYKADPNAVAAFLPEPLGPGDEPDMVYVSFSKWWSLCDNQLDMPFVNPERTWYTETIVWVCCSYKGQQGQTCVLSWVDNDFTLARGWFMGFPKKLGRTYKTDYHPMNPKMKPLGPGSRLKGYLIAHEERLMEGTLDIKEKITPADLPKPMGLPAFNIRHFPSIVRGAPPSVLELVKLDIEDVRHGDVWSGEGTLKFFSSEIEEHTLLAPKEIVGAYYFTSSSTIMGGQVLHSWV